MGEHLIVSESKLSTGDPNRMTSLVWQPAYDGTSAPFAQQITLTIPKILLLLKIHTGHDFTCYKEGLLHRQISRRMIITHSRHIEEYLQLIRLNPLELRSLAGELLIGVTGFFRDIAAFEFLARSVLPVLFKNKPATSSIRIWAPGCATGEEAYSLAMIFHEHLNKFRQWSGVNIRILATDINAEAIQVARAGIYPPDIIAQLPSRYLADYFEPVEAGYQVRPILRKMISFLPHSLVHSPQIGPVDLISCRNLLIYLKPEIQKEVLALFYAHLEANGFLFLGRSESVGHAPDLFALVEAKWRIFQRKTSSFLAEAPLLSPDTLSLNE